uniref:tRNA (guanine(9)-N(1))-methyltransferase n=1 Tax=Arion vulgaris TaxID=1028688 RepID=A0A0B7A077_9EUPU
MDQNSQTIVDFNSEEVSSQQEAKMSKNQLKKQRKREKWLSIKHERRRHIKENRKHRLAEMREMGVAVGPTRKSLKSNTMKNSSCKIRVVLDLSLDEYMAEKDVNSLACQLQHSYSANRRAENPMQLYLCGLGGKTKQRLDDIGDYNGWDIHKETRDYEQLFPKESLIYLSSESTNVLTTLSEDKVYIIGGLVDHNRHKGLCHKIAEERGIFHAQLPIAEYLDMKSRKVLAVNHVFSILLRYTETNDWRSALLSEMPQRKQAHLKGENTGDGTSQTNNTASLKTSDLQSNMSTEDDCNNKPDCVETCESPDLKSDLCTTDNATLHHELLASNKETIIENQENCEQQFPITNELNTIASCCEKDNTKDVYHISNKEMQEDNVQLETTSV